MLAIRLPEEIEARLDDQAKRTGRTKSFYIREAVLEHLADLQDIYLAESRLEDLQAGRSRTFTLDEVEQELGLADSDRDRGCGDAAKLPNQFPSLRAKRSNPAVSTRGWPIGGATRRP